MKPDSVGVWMNRSYSSADLSKFLQDRPAAILGELAERHRHDLDANQRNAWLAQISMLRSQLKEWKSGHLFFEFGIPRIGKRVDVVFVHAGIVFVIEFKVGAKRHLPADIEQVVDYALDLKHFHEGSHSAIMVPVLVATATPQHLGTAYL